MLNPEMSNRPMFIIEGRYNGIEMDYTVDRDYLLAVLNKK
jgi:hypothetical protein